jgi:hypothetical protein
MRNPCLPNDVEHPPSSGFKDEIMFCVKSGRTVRIWWILARFPFDEEFWLFQWSHCDGCWRAHRKPWDSDLDEIEMILKEQGRWE